MTATSAVDLLHLQGQHKMAFRLASGVVRRMVRQRRSDKYRRFDARSHRGSPRRFGRT